LGGCNSAVECLLPKQDVGSSNLLARSSTCLNKMSVQNLLTRYQLEAKAEGLSPKTVEHTRRVVGFFDAFMDGIEDVREVQADDLRRFLIALRQKTKWAGLPCMPGSRLSLVVRLAPTSWLFVQLTTSVKKYDNPIMAARTRPYGLDNRHPIGGRERAIFTCVIQHS
jgi:hypothetical protein